MGDAVLEFAALIFVGTAFSAAPLYLLWLGAIPAKQLDKVRLPAERISQDNERPPAKDAA
jgi:hypothetical protein